MTELQCCLDSLKQLFGERFSTQPGLLKQHGLGEAFFPSMPPDALIYPTSTAEVSAAVKTCARFQVPMIAFGAGTSLEGHFLAAQGGVCFDFSQMNKILRVSSDDLDCAVQPGVTRNQLNQYLRETGLMFPIDPGADATLGGMIATNASGTNAVRYGTMKDMVINLTVVMASGEVVKTASRAKKSAAGYDLTRLLVGSEGTLGIITEATLKLFGIPEATVAGICSFDTVEQAVNTVIKTIQNGLQMGRLELLDATQIKMLNQYFSKDYPEKPSLWYELQGSAFGVDEQAELFLALVLEYQGAPCLQAKSAQQRNQLWHMRHQLWNVAIAYNPGKQGWSTDVCVPISSLTKCIIKVQQNIEMSGLVCSILGHVGDGNFHVLIMFDAEKPKQLEAARTLSQKVVTIALSMDGTCTGEHGIGMGKIDKLEQELPSAIPVMKAIKQALDPQGLLNPGKILR